MPAVRAARRESTAAGDSGQSILEAALERAGARPAAAAPAGGPPARDQRLFDLPPRDRAELLNRATIEAASTCADEHDRWWLFGVAIGVHRSARLDELLELDAA